MYRTLRVGVSVPAHNEEKLIGRVIETMPDFVDLIVVVDDCSTDGTAAVVAAYQAERGERVELIRHTVNTGVGGAVMDGYKRACAAGMDVVVVMAGDAQMDPADLPGLLDPIAEGKADHVRGNRLFMGEVWKVMPRYRFFGNHVLSLLTKIASGYWHVADSQCGYTATTCRALRMLDLDRIASRYEFETDLLMHLSVMGLRVVNAPVRPVYGIGEKSGIRAWRFTLRMSAYLVKAFLWRLWAKYVVHDFHPLVFFYLTGIILVIPGSLLGVYLVAYRLLGGVVAVTSALFALFLTIMGWQFLLFAFWFDMEAGRRRE